LELIHAYHTEIYNKLNKSHLVGQLLNSIHDARTHVYIKKKCYTIVPILNCCQLNTFALVPVRIFL